MTPDIKFEGKSFLFFTFSVINIYFFKIRIYYKRRDVGQDPGTGQAICWGQPCTVGGWGTEELASMEESQEAGKRDTSRYQCLLCPRPMTYVISPSLLMALLNTYDYPHFTDVNLEVINIK